MIRRAAAAAIVLALALGMTTACQPEPAPSASGPVFANEEEAFAAAEETYRAYVDALNQVDLSDPETAEAVLVWTIGKANDEDRQGYERLREAGATVNGKSLLVSASHESASDLANAWTVVLGVCLDVSDVKLEDAEGTSMVDPSRPDIQSIDVNLVSSDKTPTGLAIAETGPAQEAERCVAS